MFNMIISGNSILSGGNCKIEGSIVVLFVNLILMFGFVMAKKKRDKNMFYGGVGEGDVPEGPCQGIPSP